MKRTLRLSLLSYCDIYPRASRTRQNVGQDSILSIWNGLDRCGLLLLRFHVSDRLSRPHASKHVIREEMSLQDGGEPHSALQKLAATESQKKEPEKKAGARPSEHRTSHLSQAHLLAGAVKRRSSSQSSEGSKKQKAEETVAGNGSQTEQEAVEPKSPGAGVTRSGVLHLPSAAVCVGILPGLGAYSGSSDSESSSDSEGSVDEIGSPIKRHRLFR
ncbi:PSME3-interacting protein isoform X1 [Ctenopharyngodon idella]|uniref:PSME3-interacting protein isoform X1 n=1 Tax=Ctenopharyngodon idella TaxID=7959 RepID=UPI002231CD9F|nr:PSME3-interacting protein isoform X1 [Ctenopharyngodon idella]